MAKSYNLASVQDIRQRSKNMNSERAFL